MKVEHVCLTTLFEVFFCVFTSNDTAAPVTLPFTFRFLSVLVHLQQTIKKHLDVDLWFLSGNSGGELQFVNYVHSAQRSLWWVKKLLCVFLTQGEILVFENYVCNTL